jgi:hypothetical protein
MACLQARNLSRRIKSIRYIFFRLKPQDSKLNITGLSKVIRLAGFFYFSDEAAAGQNRLKPP